MSSLFIFRNDLRIFDNTALIEASKNTDKIFPIFIFNKKQFSKEENNFYNEKIVKFMIELLDELETKIEEKNGTLSFFFGENEKIIEKILEENNDIKKVFVNKDYTPFSILRDKKIKEICDKKEREFFEYDDRVLNPPNKVLKDNNSPYSVFTPYYNRAKLIEVKKPNDFEIKNFSSEKIVNEFSKSLEDIKEKNF